MPRPSDPRVLIVDANAHIRRLIATLLSALSVKDVAEARAPSAAVPLMLAKAPDLIIVDFTGDPTETVLFMHRIRQGDLGDRTTPVLALAASTHHALLEQARTVGFDDVLAKPISALDLIQRSAALMNGHPRMAAE